MRVSRISFAVVVTSLWFITPALAQLGPPLPLAPPPPPRQAPAITDVPPPAPPVSNTSSSDDDFHATPLAPMDASWVGTLGPADGALPHSMWGATPRALVAAGLPLLQPTTSPGLQDLARRLLLSDATAPSGQDVPGRPGLPELRLNRLLALGRLDGVKLIDTLPQVTASENFDRDSVELRFAANDGGGACRIVQDRVARYRNVWWDRALIACQALNGAYDQAALGLSVMRDQASGRDLVFEALIDTILGHRQKLDKLPEPTPMRVALLAAAKLPLPADTLTAAGPAALAVWATSDKVPAAQRLDAAEKAAAFGALPPEALGLVYADIEATPQEQAAALKSGKPPEDARGRAMLFDIARSNNNAATRVAMLTPLLADARRRGALIPMARLVAPLIAELPPAPEFQSFAGDAARVLLATGHADQAAPWIDLGKSAELRVVADLAQSGHADDNAPSLTDAAAALVARDANAAPRQIDLLAVLSSALGEKLGELDVAPLLQPAHQGLLPGAALWLDQQQAASAGRVGETVLTSLLIAAAGDRLSPEPVLLARVVSGLKAVGLEADARALAVEAALAAGI
jgi:hypothetical protein